MQPTGETNQFEYHSSENVPTQAVQPADEQKAPPKTQLVKWQASEFIDHQKNAGWFLMFGLGMLVVSGLVYLLTKSLFSAVVLLIAGIVFGVFARQRPRTLTYSLTPSSIQIDSKSYSFNDFRSFSVMQEGGLYSVLLEPLKRFMPPLTIYFDPKDGEKIFDTLSSHIPHEEKKVDPIERLMRKIRF